MPCWERLWTGKCVFNESWDDLTNGVAMDQVEVKPSLPKCTGGPFGQKPQLKTAFGTLESHQFQSDG